MKEREGEARGGRPRHRHMARQSFVVCWTYWDYKTVIVPLEDRTRLITGTTKVPSNISLFQVRVSNQLMQ